jgi:hypothetical protein
MDKRNEKEPDKKRDEALRDDKSLLRKDLFAVRGRLYDKIKIPLKTLDIIIYVLVGALILAILLGIGSNR